MQLTPSQQRTLAFVPKITGWCSLFFSTLLVLTVLRDKSRRGLCYHRLLCGISLMDISGSFWFGMTTWPMPKDTSDAVWAIGNQVTCRVQGFFVQFAISSSFYNASLSIYYYLVIVKGWNEKRLQRIEWLLHGVPLLWALCSALAGLYLDVYADATLWCWASAEEDLFRLFAFYCPLWGMIFIVTINCAAIFWHMRNIELKSHQNCACANAASQMINWDVTAAAAAAVVQHQTVVRIDPACDPTKETTATTAAGSDEIATSQNIIFPSRPSCTSCVPCFQQQEARAHSKRLKVVAMQCFLYACSFYLNWAALTATRVIERIEYEVYYPLILIAAITTPIQGLPNFLVYLMPKLHHFRRFDPSSAWWKWLVRSMAPQESRFTSFRHRVSSLGALDPSQIDDEPEDGDGDKDIEEEDNYCETDDVNDNSTIASQVQISKQKCSSTLDDNRLSSQEPEDSKSSS